MKHELQNIISGKSQVEHGAIIQAATNYLRNGKGASSLVKESNHFKKQEESLLTSFANENSLWVTNIDSKQFISSGAEQLVCLKRPKIIIKIPRYRTFQMKREQ